ncbi:MAG: methyltransferase domain-containing protein [Rhodobacteraceae bacterium]|nr:methyltransferase domain-containing protein [Paracoccaceae bacterium]
MDDHYKERALVDLYDSVNASRKDFGFYLDQLPDPPARILDIGCGTGTFALQLAERGYSVTGVDPASEMLANARAKPGSDAVEWIIGFASDVPLGAPFDVAVMTGHAFQCLLQDDDIADLFRAVAARLDHGGSFWFETRNPGAQPWTRWTPEHAGPPFALSDGRRVQVVHRVLDVTGEYVCFEELYEISDQPGTVSTRSILRFPSLEKIRHLAQENGLELKTAFGDWQKGALHDNSPEIIVRLEKVSQPARSTQAQAGSYPPPA